MYFQPSMAKISMTETFRNTMKPLKMELPSVPRIGEEAHQHYDKEGGDIYDSTIPGTGGEGLR